MAQSEIGHSSSIEAAINAGQPTILYDAGGRSMAVPPEDVDHWLSQGLLRTPYDPEEMISELKVLGPSVIDGFVSLVETVGVDGVIDTNEAAAMATASRAQQHFNSICARILRGIEARYPVKDTGETVRMIGTDSEGREFETDIAAEQEEMYAEDHGYRLA